MMRALTLIQPWAYAVAHLGKDVENRTWPPPDSVIGKRIAIHGGRAKQDYAAFAWLVSQGYSVPLTPVYGAVVATAVVDGYGTRNTIESEWFGGPIGWLFADVIALPEPVPCRGAQGLWVLPPDVEERVRAQEAKL